MGVTVFGSFEAAEPAWRAVETRAAHHPFQSLAWLAAWHRHFGRPGGVTPVIAVVEDQVYGEFLLPLGIRRRGPARVLSWLGGTVSDYHGPLIASSRPVRSDQRGFEAFWTRVQETLPPFDAVHLRRQPERIGAHPNPFALLPSHPVDRAFAARITPDWDRYYMAHRGSRSRKQDRRRRRRLEERGALRFAVAETPDEAERYTREAVSLKQRRFPGDPHLDSAHVRFYVELARRHVDTGAVVACSLRLDDEPLAAEWGVRSNGRIAVTLSGYRHGDLSRYSPGSLLQQLAMEWCAGHGITTYDFLAGDEPYKLTWADDEMTLSEHLTARTPAGHAYVAAQSLRRSVKRRPALLAVARRARGLTRRLRTR